jgi:hypothetical protein
MSTDPAQVRTRLGMIHTTRALTQRIHSHNAFTRPHPLLPVLELLVDIATVRAGGAEQGAAGVCLQANKRGWGREWVVSVPDNETP